MNTEKAKADARAHFGYTAGVIEACGITGLAVRLGEYLYTQAYVHGAKHMAAGDYDDEENIDLSVCPHCGGVADNGFDRCVPPNPYWCTKCEENYMPSQAELHGDPDGELIC